MRGRSGVWPGASTVVAAVVGSPIRHSLSPTIHNAAFESTGLDWAFTAFDAVDGPAVLRGAIALGLRGLSVTMPLKTVLAEEVDDLTPRARLLGAVNTITISEGRSLGDSHDGAGFLDSLEAGNGWSAAGRRVVVFGAGGAARAVIAALAEAGAAEVIVVNRNAERAARAASLGGPGGRVGVPGDVAAADLVVNATSVGMAGTDAAGRTPCDVELIGPHHLIAELVYHPLETPLLAAARLRGAAVADGVGMLVHQAARAFEGWTGCVAPIEVMDAAARAALIAQI
ncbi:MAG: shikimate dehydrogenase [Acidimicrobiales bacterium]